MRTSPIVDRGVADGRGDGYVERELTRNGHARGRMQASSYTASEMSILDVMWAQRYEFWPAQGPRQPIFCGPGDKTEPPMRASRWTESASRCSCMLHGWSHIGAVAIYLDFPGRGGNT